MELTTVYLNNRLMLIVNSHIIGTALEEFTPDKIREICDSTVSVGSVDLPSVEVSRPPLVPSVEVTEDDVSDRARPRKARPRLPDYGTMRREILDAVFSVWLLGEQGTLRSVMEWMGHAHPDEPLKTSPEYKRISSQLSALCNIEKLLLRSEVDNPEYNGKNGHAVVYSYYPARRTERLYEKAGIGRLH